MTSNRGAKAFEDVLSGQAVSAGTELRIEDPLDFQFVRASRCSTPMLLEISDFLDTQDTSHPFQLPQWTHRETYLAVLRRRGRVRWFAHCGVLYPAGRVLPFVRALTVNRGPVCDDLELLGTGLQQLIVEGKKRKVAYVDIAPEWTGAFAESAASVLARNGWQTLPGVRSSLRLDLNPTLGHLLANFRKTTRYEIRRSEGRGVEVKIAGDEADFHDFLRLYANMASQKRFPAENVGFLAGVFRWLAADQGRGAFFLAQEGGTLRGGILVVRSGVRCWYILGATAKDSKFSAGHLLQWRAIQWAKEQGCMEYDFGGFREGLNTGPALFKSGFCDRVVHFPPQYRCTVDQHRRRLADLTSSLRNRLLLFKGSGAARG
jgi:hypothetical protein